VNEKTNRNRIILNAISALLIFTIVSGCFIIGQSNTAFDGRAGSEFDAAGRINSEIADEQQRALGGVADSQDRIGRSLEALERIRGITASANSALGELGELNRGSSDISAAIRAEAQLLEGYLRSISSVLGSLYGDMGAEQVNNF
jgi:hypothetical protein